MSGAKSGVAKQISAKEPRAVYTHCYGHALNLAVGDTIKQIKLLRDSMDTTFEMSKLVKYSPKRDTLFEKLKQELAPDTPGFRSLCPTRWTVRANSLKSVLENYAVLLDLWDKSYSEVKDTEVRARIKGVEAQMRSFDFLFGVMLGEAILRHTDNLSKGLQHKDLSASEGQCMATLTLETLSRMRSEDKFSEFFGLVEEKASREGVEEPSLPRRRKMPKRYEQGSGAHFFPETNQQRYRKVYFEALDLVVNCVKTRFDQPGYRVLRNVEDLLVKAVRSEFEAYQDEFAFVTNFYGEDLDAAVLKVQLETLRTEFERSKSLSASLSSIFDYFRELQPAMRTIYSQIVRLIKLLIVMPATNATSERSFSALRRVKTYLRSTMTQQRLNSLMTLHVHIHRTDALNLNQIANDYTSKSERRMAVFGKF